MAHDSASPYRAVILTALPDEYKAVRSHLVNLKESTHKQGTVYEIGDFGHRRWEVILAEVGAGNTQAALEAERAITAFDPALALFVGVAGGLKDVGIGDVVAATKVYGYESGKVRATFEPRPEVGMSSFRIEQRAIAEAKKADWLARVSPIPPIPPRVFVGPIAAGEKVLAERRSSLYQFLRSSYGDALAAEMEGRGFLQATRAHQHVEALVIRGISDLVSRKTVADRRGSQWLAACHASAFAFEVLSKFDPFPEKDLKVKWAMVLSGTVSEVNKPIADAILEQLRKISGDATLKIWKVQAGSIVLLLEGSLEGFELVRSLVESRVLTKLLEFQVRGIHFIPTSDMEESPIQVFEPELGLEEPVQGEPGKTFSLLIVDVDETTRKTCSAVAQLLGFRTGVVDSAERAYQMLDSQRIDAILIDLKLPGVDSRGMLLQIQHRSPDADVIVLANLPAQAAMEATRSGAYDYVIKPVRTDEFRLLLTRLARHLRLKTENRALRETVQSTLGFDLIIGRSPEMEKLYRVIAKSASGNYPMLITGEPGSGKETVARFAHNSGPLRRKPFVYVNCAALAPDLMDAELFGFVAGSFVGAVKAKKGQLAIAEGGTLFLDEVDQLPVELQVKLLRALQEREIQPVGGTTRVPITVRILAASGVDLEQAVSTGRFRRDLYFRLNVLSLRIPPLRERQQDIPLLAEHLLGRIAGSAGSERQISDEAMRALIAYSWPGNVRELQNCLLRAFTSSEAPMIQLKDLPPTVIEANHADVQDPKGSFNILPMAEQEKKIILDALAMLKGDKLTAARLLGIDVTTLDSKLRGRPSSRAQDSDDWHWL